LSEQYSGVARDVEPDGYGTSTELPFSEGTEHEHVDLAHFKDFLLVLQGCNVRAFSGYGISVSFADEGGGFDSAPAQSGRIEQLPSEPSTMSADIKDGWRNPNLWPQQNGRVLKFDGSFE
jgi:hypothetical protein